MLGPRRRGRVLGAPPAVNCFRYVRSAGVSSTGKRLWDMGSSRRQGIKMIVAGTVTGGPPIHPAPYIDTELTH